MYFKTLKTNLFPEESKKPGKVAMLAVAIKKLRQKNSVFYSFDRVGALPKSSRVVLPA